MTDEWWDDPCPECKHPWHGLGCKYTVLRPVMYPISREPCGCESSYK